MRSRANTDVVRCAKHYEEKELQLPEQPDIEDDSNRFE